MPVCACLCECLHAGSCACVNVACAVSVLVGLHVCVSYVCVHVGVSSCNSVVYVCLDESGWWCVPCSA